MKMKQYGHKVGFKQRPPLPLPRALDPPLMMLVADCIIPLAKPDRILITSHYDLIDSVQL